LKPLRIGSRGSALALWQSNHIRIRLAELHGVESEIVRIHTSGDHFQGATISQIGMKGIFIKELEDALLSGAIDLAVHSMKDVPTEIPGGLAFPAISKREDVRDCVISHRCVNLDKLPAGSRVGTSSLRRQAQLLFLRPDVQPVELRGNVDTRIKKVAAGEYYAIILAKAGVDRLGMSEKITQVLPTSSMLPAVGQGALGIETREDDRETSVLVAGLNDEATRTCVTAERSLLRELEGGCQVPLGAWARLGAAGLLLEACVLSPDGKEHLRREQSGAPEEAEKIGKRLGQVLLEAGADRILRLAGRGVGNG
jgi:hydroxymethylbilane synthase